MRTPAGLQVHGKALWKKITGQFDLKKNSFFAGKWSTMHTPITGDRG